MAKSKIKFNTPRLWTAADTGVMREDGTGYFVRLEDYKELLAAYKGALVQLDRAAKRIADMHKGLPPNGEGERTAAKDRNDK